MDAGNSATRRNIASRITDMMKKRRRFEEAWNDAGGDLIRVLIKGKLTRLVSAFREIEGDSDDANQRFLLE
jgi:hypothetical protein